MSHLIAQIGTAEPNVQGDVALGPSEKIFGYRVNSDYGSGTLGYPPPLNAPFYNGVTSAYYTIINHTGFSLDDSPDLVAMLATTSTPVTYWWDLVVVPAGRWLIRGTYAGDFSSTAEGYIQWQTSTGTVLGPRARFSATEAGSSVAIGIIDSTSTLSVRLRFVGTGSFYRSTYYGHLLSGVSLVAF